MDDLENWMIIRFTSHKQLVYFTKSFDFMPNIFSAINPFLKNHPGTKSLVRHSIETIPSTNHQRRPLPLLCLILLLCMRWAGFESCNF